MSRRASVVSTTRRSSILSVGGQNKLDDEQISNQEIVEKLLSKEEQRKLERERLIAQLEKEDENEETEEEVKSRSEKTGFRKCPYLDTINREILDFDFEKLCSVSLSHMNVYCCLVTGKYFQGMPNSSFMSFFQQFLRSGQGNPCLYTRSRKWQSCLSELTHGQVLLPTR